MQNPKLRQVLIDGFSAAFFVRRAQIGIGETEVVSGILYGKAGVLVMLFQIAVHAGNDIRILTCQCGKICP